MNPPPFMTPRSLAKNIDQGDDEPRRDGEQDPAQPGRASGPERSLPRPRCRFCVSSRSSAAAAQTDSRRDAADEHRGQRERAEHGAGTSMTWRGRRSAERRRCWTSGSISASPITPKTIPSRYVRAPITAPAHGRRATTRGDRNQPARRMRPEGQPPTPGPSPQEDPSDREPGWSGGGPRGQRALNVGDRARRVAGRRRRAEASAAPSGAPQRNLRPGRVESARRRLRSSWASPPAGPRRADQRLDLLDRSRRPLPGRPVRDLDRRRRRAIAARPSGSTASRAARRR